MIQGLVRAAAARLREELAAALPAPLRSPGVYSPDPVAIEPDLG